MASSVTIDLVKQVIRDSLRLGEDAAIADDMPLVGGEYDLDSLDMLLVVTNIEKAFGIKIPERDLGKHVFESITTLAGFVERQRSA